MSFVLKNIRRKDGSITYQITESHRIPGTKTKQKSKVVEKFNSKDLIEEGIIDTDRYANEKLQEWKEKRNEEKREVTITIDPKKKLEFTEDGGRFNRVINIGYAVYSFIYHELELDKLINARRQHVNCKSNLNVLFQHHLYSRLLFPSSKINAYENRDRFYGDTDYTKYSFYRALDNFLKWREDILVHIDEKIKEKYGRTNSILYYDVTNYYFERDEEDELRGRGVSKEHRPEPIVQMGLFMDEKGLPITYELYRGNTHDSLTLEDSLDNSIIDFKRKRKIIVADKGMLSYKNILKIRNDKNGYVISQSIRKSDKESINYVLDKEGWTVKYDEKGEEELKIKERIIPRKVRAEGEEDAKVHSGSYNERQIFIWSKKYSDRAKLDREIAIEKAKQYEGVKSKDYRDTTYGKLKYVKKTPLKDGKEIETDNYRVDFDEEKLREDEKLDGYYMIVTNVVGLLEGERPREDKSPDYCYYSKDGFLTFNKRVSAEDIQGIYAGLWRIEETFKLTKTGMLSLRPVFHSLEERIRAHFLVCFVALVMERLLEYRLNWKYSAKKIQRALSTFNITRLEGSNYSQVSSASLFAKEIFKTFGLDVEDEYYSQSQIRQLFAETKKDKN